MKIFFMFICFTIAFLHAKAQVVAPNWAWTHNFNGSISKIEYHNDHIYTAGTFSDSAFILGNVNIPNNGGKDVVIAKWDTLGNLIWATSIYGSADETVVNFKINSNNELVVALNSNSATVNAGGNILNNNGSYDIFVCKYNLSGVNQNNFVIGTAANEQATDICIDDFNNIYIASGGIKKYTNAGTFILQLANGGDRIYYSSFDSTIVSTYITWVNAFYVSKSSMSGGTLWSVFVAQANGFGIKGQTYIQKNTGKIFVAISKFSNNVPGLLVYLLGYSSAGISEGLVDIFGGVDLDGPWSLDGKDDLISIGTSDISYSALTVYDINTNQKVKDYGIAGANYNIPSFQLFRGLTSIYTLGYENNIFRKFGKIGDGSLIGLPSYQDIEVCAGNLTTLTGNITGGIGPLTYSWLPVTGLNNTNTNTVNFTAVSNISYTLTVTDGVNTAKDTFNIIVQNPIPPANITSQFLAFCDTMILYSNNGVAGDWYQLLPANPPNNQWQLIATDTVVTIYAADTYRYTKSNACNSAADTIVIPGILTVNANTSSDSICAGQSVTLNGSGALSYAWTGGVVNNIPFSPFTTQTYIVTGTDAGGCSNTSFVQITILSSNNTSTLSICQNQIPYTWNGQSLDSTGTYTANYTNVFGCDSAEILNLNVSPCIVCVPNFTINYSPFYNTLTESQSWIMTSGTVLILAGDKVKLDANTNSYVMLNPGFKADSGSVFVAQAYNGCTAGAPQLPQIGKAFKEDLSTAADEIVLYPNPTTGMIHIRHDEKLTGIQIFDMVGKLIINQKCLGETETNIDLSNLPNGVYHVKAAGYKSVKVIKNN